MAAKQKTSTIDYLTCELPLFGELAEKQRIASRDKRVSARTRQSALETLAVIDALNEVVPLLRTAKSDNAALQQTADELRQIAQARQAEAQAAVASAQINANFRGAHEKAQEYIHALEQDIQDKVADRAEQLLEPLKARHAREIGDLKLLLAAQSKENHMTDARAYSLAFLLGVAVATVVAVVIALPYFS